jgi:hypothetical protein
MENRMAKGPFFAYRQDLLNKDPHGDGLDLWYEVYQKILENNDTAGSCPFPFGMDIDQMANVYLRVHAGGFGTRAWEGGTIPALIHKVVEAYEEVISERWSGIKKGKVE